jgi:hypothetical protein
MIARGNEELITGMFVGAGLLADMVIPGLLIMGDRVHDHLGTGEVGISPGNFLIYPSPATYPPGKKSRDLQTREQLIIETGKHIYEPIYLNEKKTDYRIS